MSESGGHIRSHRDLVAWQKAMELVVAVYSASKTFPKEETYGLTNQLRRAAVSVSANIAEGQGRRSKSEFRQFLGNARARFWNWILIWNSQSASDTCSEGQHSLLHTRLQEVGRVLNGLLRSLNTDL